MLKFSEKQQTTITAAITLFGALFIVCSAVAIFMAMARFLAFFSNVFMPLAVAAICALVLKPYYNFLVAHVRLELLAVFLVFVTVLLPLVSLFWFFGSILVQQIFDLTETLPIWYEQIVEKIRAHMPMAVEFFYQHDIGERAKESLEGKEHAVAIGMQQIIRKIIAAGLGFIHIVTGFLGWIVFPIYLGFFLMSQSITNMRLGNALPFLKPETRRDAVYLVTEFINIVVAFFRGQILVALVQAALYATAYGISGLQYGVAIGLLTGLGNIVPFLGSMLGFCIAVPTAFFQPDGGYMMLIRWGIAFSVVQLIETYFTTPRIMGQRTGLHPLMIIVGIFFWSTALNGMLGVILAVPLTAFLVIFWRLLKTKYIKEIV